MKSMGCPHNILSLQYRVHRSQDRLISLSISAAVIAASSVVRATFILVVSAFTTSVIYSHGNFRVRRQYQQHKRNFFSRFDDEAMYDDQRQSIQTFLHSARRIPTTLCWNVYPQHRPQRDYQSSHHATTESTDNTTINVHQPEDGNKYRKQSYSVPEPKERHIVLPSPPSEYMNEERSGILVVGDVHGCYDELLLLYEKAVVENKNKPFYYVILVGDVCNKGPKNLQVIRHVRNNEPYWKTIRGNHEHAVLNAHEVFSKGNDSDKSEYLKKYGWLIGEESIESDGKKSTRIHFTDSDYEWMSALPYTIRIPANHIGLRDENDESYENDVIVVHAGLIPGMNIESNDISTMVVLRDLPSTTIKHIDATEGTTKVPWASLWNGPELVIFGHDAKRGLQLHDKTIGLDTGCVYGNKLTGIILPQRKLVQIDALKQHTPIIEK